MQNEVAGVVPDEVLREEKQRLVEDFVAALKKVELEPGYVPDRGKQLKILENLPDNLVAEMHAHLHATQIEEDFFSDLKKRDRKIIDDSYILGGELFEVLVRAEYPDYISPVGEELLAASHDPERFNLAMRTKRNPDVAFIDVTREGDIIVKGVGEVKLGYISARFLDQIEKFRGTLEEVVASINDLDDLGAHGFECVEARGGNVQISPEFKQVLFVPADRDLEDKAGLIGTKHVRSWQREAIRSLLESDTVHVQQAAFSGNEVTALKEVLLKKVQARY